MKQPAIEEVQKAYADKWMAVPGVVGVAIGACSGTPCLKVMVEKITAGIEDIIPSEIDGYPVELEETGIIRPL